MGHVDLEADQLVGPLVALAEQNVIDLAPAPCLAAHLYKQTIRGIAAGGGQRRYEYRGANYPFGRVVSMRFLGGEWFPWEGSLEKGSRPGDRS